MSDIFLYLLVLVHSGVLDDAQAVNPKILEAKLVGTVHGVSDRSWKPLDGDILEMCREVSQKRPILATWRSPNIAQCCVRQFLASSSFVQAHLVSLRTWHDFQDSCGKLCNANPGAALSVMAHTSAKPCFGFLKCCRRGDVGVGRASTHKGRNGLVYSTEVSCCPEGGTMPTMSQLTLIGKAVEANSLRSMCQWSETSASRIGGSPSNSDINPRQRYVHSLHPRPARLHCTWSRKLPMTMYSSVNRL